MAGHSQFKNIMYRKGAQDARRARLFTKIIREITVAVKTGSPDPSANPRLRSALAEARTQNMPKENIDRAIKKATEGVDGANYETVRYEGYGPHAVAVIIEALTDNRNRTASDIRAAFTRHGGSLGESGSVAFMFDHRGRLFYGPERASAEQALEAAIESGADTVDSTTDGHEILCAVSDFGAVRDGLEARLGSPDTAKLVWIPNIAIDLDEESAAGVLKFLDALEDFDDVQTVAANFEISEAVAARLASQ
jgi:YebC/PmpR family DNA-binding regulatory protein